MARGGRKTLVVVRGAGDLATGVLARLWRAGYAPLALEIEEPLAIRRTVAFSEAVYEGRAVVEGIEARLVADAAAAQALLTEGLALPVLVDPQAVCLRTLRPPALVDAILAKRNLGTRLEAAPLVIALGPGFTAGQDCHLVIETNRGHDLGRVYAEGSAEPDTGTPGEIGGQAALRVIKAPASGLLEVEREIASMLRVGDLIAYIKTENGNVNMYAKIDGILRGMLRSGRRVNAGLKIADLDPRGRPEHCLSISDKARALGGAVLEALLSRGIVP